MLHPSGKKIKIFIQMGRMADSDLKLLHGNRSGSISTDPALDMKLNIKISFKYIGKMCFFNRYLIFKWRLARFHRQVEKRFSTQKNELFYYSEQQQKTRSKRFTGSSYKYTEQADTYVRYIFLVFLTTGICSSVCRYKKDHRWHNIYHGMARENAEIYTYFTFF